MRVAVEDAFLREQDGACILCAFNLEASPRTLTLPGEFTPMDLGTGTARLDGRNLTLAPSAAFFGIQRGQ